MCADSDHDAHTAVARHAVHRALRARVPRAHHRVQLGRRPVLLSGQTGGPAARAPLLRVRRPRRLPLLPEPLDRLLRRAQTHVRNSSHNIRKCSVHVHPTQVK